MLIFMFVSSWSHELMRETAGTVSTLGITENYAYSFELFVFAMGVWIKFVIFSLSDRLTCVEHIIVK